MVREVVESHEGLNDFAKTHEWMVGFLEEVVKADLGTSVAVRTKLECLSEREARQIGKNLMPALKARKTPEAGLAQWKGDHKKSMGKLLDETPWFEAMMVELAKGVVKTAPWGLRWRVGLGALLSTVDLITDIVMIIDYFRIWIFPIDNFRFYIFKKI